VAQINDKEDEKIYAYYSLGKGETDLKKTRIRFPYYVISWEDNNTQSLQKLKDEYSCFKDENSSIFSKYPNMKNIYYGIKIFRTTFRWVKGEHHMTLYGNIIEYSSIRHEIPFKIEGIEGDILDFKNAIIEQSQIIKEVNDDSINEAPFYSKKESSVGNSEIENYDIIQKDNKYYLSSNNRIIEIFKEVDL